MNNRDRFFEAFAHTEHRVLGRVLARFTLRHRFWLEAFGSPLVTGGEVTLVDLEMATRICALPFPALEVAVPRMLARGPGWRDKAGYGWRVLFRRVGREYADFQAYLLDHGCPPATHGSGPVECGVPDGPPPVPGMKRKPARIDDSGLPNLLSLVTGLMRCGWSDPERVWALSPGQAEWYLAGGYMQRGVDVKLKSPHDEEFEEHFARLRAEKAVPSDQ